jgi:dTDP-4-dehydrorhamnose reductase
MNHPSLMIIGSRGFVGAHVAAAAADRYEVLPDAGIDITCAETVRSAFDRQRPEVVILTAAISDIDRCQRESERAELVNVTGAEIVATECARIGARLIFTSSGAVFDGLKHGYTEDEPPTPISVYGETKARAERIVTAIPRAVIVRISLVLGLGLRPGSNSLLDKLVASFSARRPVNVAMNESRNPIDVETLAWFLLALADRPMVHGIYHLGSSNSWSRYDLIAAIADRLNAPKSLLILQNEPNLGRAPRGLDHFLISTKIAAACGAPVPTTRQVLERCFDAVAQSHS